MTRKDPSTMTDDEKVEALTKAGIISDEGETPIKPEGEKPEEIPPAPKVEDAEVPPTPSPDGDEEDEVPPTDDKKPDTETPPKEEPAKVEVPNPAIPKKDGQETLPPSTDKTKRNVRFMPIDKYLDEKRERDQKEKDLQDEITKLRAGDGSTKPADQDEHDKFIATFAEKYGMEEDDVRKLIPKTAAVVPKEILDDLEKTKAENIALAEKQRLADEEAFFATEFTKVAPTLKEYYPNLTPEKEAAIKAELKGLAYSQEWHDKDLDYVIFKNRSVLDPIANATEEVSKAPRRTAEGGRPGGNTSKSISAADFKGKKTFDELGEMDDATRNKIIMDMDPVTYGSFTSWVAQQENGGGVKVQRDGKTVILK